MQHRASVQREKIRAELGFQQLAAVYLGSLIRYTAASARRPMQQLSVEGMADLRRSIDRWRFASHLNRLTDAAAMGRSGSWCGAHSPEFTVPHPRAGKELSTRKPVLLDELFVAGAWHGQRRNAFRQFHRNFHAHRLAVLHYGPLFHGDERGVLRSQAVLQADLDDLSFVFGVALLYPAPVLSH